MCQACVSAFVRRIHAFLSSVIQHCNYHVFVFSLFFLSFLPPSDLFVLYLPSVFANRIAFLCHFFHCLYFRLPYLLLCLCQTASLRVQQLRTPADCGDSS